ncbi:MAG TPA: SAM-dependent methyltransferase, partial [Candidatus Hydrogenedentes bacterium]|nr:SAM-dependent methyltransferase [Candidatus Hydrogenedentota bacterium]
YTYLGDWITRQRQDQQRGVEGADARLAAALRLQDELEKILVGEPPYDLFVRWKPLHEQAVGWEPDINDGVRMNIRPFLAARPLGARAKGACILRVTPKIKWDKDRGKEPQRPKEDFPWFWGWDEKTQDFPGGKIFDGVRWNDLHYTNAAKQAARDRKKSRSGG